MNIISIASIIIIICIVMALILSFLSQYTLIHDMEYKRFKWIENEWEAEKTAHKFEVGNLNRQLAKAKDEQQRWFAAYTEAQRELEELRKNSDDQR